MTLLTAADARLAWRLFADDAARRRQRIVLTALAVAWGTLTFVLLLSFGEGARRELRRGTRGMGEGIGVVWAGATSEPFEGLPAGRTVRLRPEDVEAVRAQVREIGAVSAEYVRWATPVSAGRAVVTARLQGVEPAYGAMRLQVPRPGGRFLDPADMEAKRRVVFLGDELAAELFGAGADAVGREVLIADVRFRVVGVLAHKIQLATYSGPDARHATIPASTFVSVFGAAGPESLVYQPSSPEQADAAKSGVYRVLGRRHGFDSGDRRALRLWDSREIQRFVDTSLAGFEVFLGLLGALTVFVAGMGVANMMYALVRERTREIGLKMALGARRQHVMMPFVLEALFITTLGGAFGAAASLAIVAGVRAASFEDEALRFLASPRFSAPVAFLTSAIIGGVGLLAGYLPARRAAAVDPVVSLRFE